MIELLVALAIMGILGGINAAILDAGFSSWNHAATRLSLQSMANDLMEVLLEGGPDSEGLRDAVELREAGLTSIAFVPLWTDYSHKPNPVTNKAQRFTLERQVKAGSVTPLAQIRKVGSTDWESIPVSFTYGTGTNPDQPDDVITVTEPIPSGAELKILYTPDAEAHPDVQMRFAWDAAQGQVYRTYSGQTKPVLRNLQGGRIDRMAFLYYDNLNRLLPLGQTYTPGELRRITGVKLYLLLIKHDEWKELTSFTNIRNVETIGATITRGSVLPLPSPQNIKAFSLGDFHGLKGDGIVELLIKTDNQRPRMKLSLVFVRTNQEDRIVLNRFQIEAPPGTIRTSAVLNQVISQNEFVNLLVLDRTGLYSYRYDPKVKNVILVKGANPVVEVTRCDFTVASLFIRP